MNPFACNKCSIPIIPLLPTLSYGSSLCCIYLYLALFVNILSLLLKTRGGGGRGLINLELEKTLASVLYKELEYKVEKLKYKKF